MKRSSACAKGRRLQQDVCKKLQELSGLHPDDIRSQSMGAPGEDVMFSSKAREIFPWSIECKNVEKLSIWKAIDQARANAGEHTPVVVFKKNHEDSQICLPFDEFLRIYAVYLGAQSEK